MQRYERDLANLRDGRYYAKKAQRPVTLKTASGLALEIPGPAVLAEVYALPWLRSRVDAYRSGSALLTRPIDSGGEPSPIHQGELANELLAAIQQLPERTTTEAGRPYRDLRLYATEASPGARSVYLTDVITYTRRLLPEWRAPKPAEERPPAMTAAERKAASRAHIRREEELSARDWLESFLTGWDGDTDAPVPGSRWIAYELYELAVEAIEESVELEEERIDGGDYRVPRQCVFYAVADQILGPRRRGAHGSARVYVIPGK